MSTMNMKEPSVQVNGSQQKSDTDDLEKAGHKVLSGKLKLSESQYKQCLKVEFAGLCLLIAAVWALLAVPIFMFHLSEINEDQTANISAVLGVIGAAPNISNTTCPSQCSKDFYCKPTPQGLICAPTCNWKEIPDASSDTTDVLVKFLVSVGVIVGIIVIVAACIRRKRVFTFPSVLVIYHNITWLVIGMTVLISLTDRHALYCVSDDLIESVLSSTGFCVFTGIVFYYGLLQLLCWWICHVTILFWKVTFPFQARSLDRSNRTKYIHAACVLFSLLLPLLPVVVTIGHDALTHGEEGVGTVGFTITRFPPLLCTSIASEATFYSLVILLILFLATGIALLILMFWFVHKQTASFNKSQNKSPLKIGTAEKKLLVIIIYYIVLAVLALTTFTIFSRTLPTFVKRLFEYFICEQPGPSSSEPCDRSGFEDLTNPIPANMSFVLLALNPWLNLIFTINISELKEFFARCVHRTKHMVLKDQTNSTVSTSDGGVSGKSE